MDLFTYDGITKEDISYLSSLAKHPGYVILKKMMEDACKKSVVKIVKLKPEDPDSDRLLKIYQLESHVLNDVCSTIVKSIAKYVKTSEDEEREQELREQLQAAGVGASLVGEKFGSTVIKSRNGKQ